MSGPLSSPRPIFEVKIEVASWVSWLGPSAPANPTGNPNFNLKNRPEVNKSGPLQIFVQFKFLSKKNFGVALALVLALDLSILWLFRRRSMYWGQFIRGSIYRRSMYWGSIYCLFMKFDISSVDISGVDLSSVNILR
jgi:hypothetical protein